MSAGFLVAFGALPRSENLIFGNMFVSSLHKFLDYHSPGPRAAVGRSCWRLNFVRKELTSAVYTEIMHAKHAEEQGIFYAGFLLRLLMSASNSSKMRFFEKWQTK